MRRCTVCRLLPFLLVDWGEVVWCTWFELNYFTLWLGQASAWAVRCWPETDSLVRCSDPTAWGYALERITWVRSHLLMSCNCWTWLHLFLIEMLCLLLALEGRTWLCHLLGLILWIWNFMSLPLGIFLACTLSLLHYSALSLLCPQELGKKN